MFVWDRAPYVENGLSKIFDEDATYTIAYAIGFVGIWVILFLALSYIIEHLKFMQADILPMPSAREPLPKEDSN
jgi:hypothetical protein